MSVGKHACRVGSPGTLHSVCCHYVRGMSSSLESGSVGPQHVSCCHCYAPRSAVGTPPDSHQREVGADTGPLSNEEAEAQRGEITHPTSHSWTLEELASESRIASWLGLDSIPALASSLPEAEMPRGGPADPPAGPTQAGTVASHLHP